MCLRNAFQPDGLPDTCNRCIPDTTWFNHLLAVWLRTFVCRIPHTDHYFLFTSFLQVWRNIKAERIKSSLMFPHLLAININHSPPINGTEMQQHIPFPDLRTKLYCISIPKRL